MMRISGVDELLVGDKSLLPVVITRKDRASKRNGRPVLNSDGRLMAKQGRLNLFLTRIPGKSSRFFRDFWHTLVNMRWRWMLLTLSLVNVVAYILVAELFLLDAWISGDFRPDFDKQKDHKCINGIRNNRNHTSFFMLGVETITTVGYGYFHPTEYCRLVIWILTFSTLITIFIDGAFISVVFAKITRPRSLAEGMFSRKAVICPRNGKFCLIFRINDRHGKHWINNRVKLFLVEPAKTTQEGEILPNFLTELKLETHGMLFWPVDIVHEINRESPLWNLSAKDLMVSQFELIATVIGTSILTSHCSKSQTSYMAKEILWGHRFSECLEYSPTRGLYVVNKKNFNKCNFLEVPLCSARYLRKVEDEMRQKKSFSMACLQ